jgi:hypothetical protein
MKNPTLLAVLLALASIAFGQMAVVDYMKVKPGNAGKYLEVEKAWRKIHEARVKSGEILSWTLYENMFAGADEAYQYVTVTIYKDFAAYEKMNWDASSKAAYPNYTSKEWDDLMQKTGESRTISSMDVFNRVVDAGVPSTKAPVYFMLSCMNVKPGAEANYEKLERDYYKPLHAEFIKKGAMEGWGIWSKFPGNMKDYQYVAVNMFSSPEQMWSGNYGEAFKKLFPAMKPEDLAKKTNEARTITESFMWKLLDDVRGN